MAKMNRHVYGSADERADEILRQRAERKERMKDKRVSLAKTFGQRYESNEEDPEEIAPRGSRYDPDVGAYKPRSQFDKTTGKLTSHAPAEKYKDTPVDQLNGILQAEKKKLDLFAKSGASVDEINAAEAEVKELEEFVKRAMMKPKVIFDKGDSRIKVYGSKANWLQRHQLYLIKVKMPNGEIKNYWPLANTHYYHGRLYFGTPKAEAKLKPNVGQNDVEGETDEKGNINVVGDNRKVVGSVIIIDDSNALVVYPKLPPAPLDAFVESDTVMGAIKEAAFNKKFHRRFFTEMMMKYHILYWKSLFGRGSSDAADAVFIKFIADGVNIHNEISEDIKQVLIARYMAVKHNYEVRDLKAYLAYDMESDPLAESARAVSEHVFSLEDEL